MYKCIKCKYRSKGAWDEPCLNCVSTVDGGSEFESLFPEEEVEEEKKEVDPFKIVDVETFLNKTIVTFADGEVVECICADGDKNDLMTAMYVAIAKKACPNVYNQASKGVKVYNRKRSAEMKEQIELYKKAIEAKREARKQKAREEWEKRHKINIYDDAIKSFMESMDTFNKLMKELLG